LEAKANGAQVIKVKGIINFTVECVKVKVEPGGTHIFGGEAEKEKLGGKNETKSIEYSECVIPGFKECTVHSVNEKKNPLAKK
jgi:hypothetical protein